MSNVRIVLRNRDASEEVVSCCLMNDGQESLDTEEEKDRREGVALS